MIHHFEWFRSKKDNQFYFHANARNGKLIMSSEGYPTKQHAFRAMKSIAKNAIKPIEIREQPALIKKPAKSIKALDKSDPVVKTKKK